MYLLTIFLLVCTLFSTGVSAAPPMPGCAPVVPSHPPRLVIDLNALTTVAAHLYRIPVTYMAPGKLHTFDFNLKFNNQSLQIMEVYPDRGSAATELHVNWYTHRKQQLLFSGSSPAGIPGGSITFYIEFSSYKYRFTQQDFIELAGTLNGQPVESMILAPATVVENDVRVYPHPQCRDIVNVVSKNYASLRCDLVDQAGNVVLTQNMCSRDGTYQIDLSALTEGVYVLNLTSECGSTSHIRLVRYR